MPMYLYRTSDEELHEVVMTIKEMLAKQRKDGTIRLDDGRRATRDIGAEQAGMDHHCALWPRESTAVGVSPKQVKKAYEDSVERGVPTEFAANGDAIFRDKHHERRYCEAIGFHQRNAGYSDAVPQG